ncbi:MAG: hypothetical protein AAGH89_13270 [Verrucomicrobiota bacterium]
MKTSAYLFAAIFWSLVSCAAQDNWSPAYPRLERYQAAWEKSPFDRDTITSDQPSFADNYALTGISRIGDDWTVLLVDRRTRKYLPISSSDKSGELRIVKVFPHSDKRQAKVKITNGQRDAILNFETELNRATGGKKANPSPQPPVSAPKETPAASDETETPRRLQLRIPKKDGEESDKAAGK